MHEAFSQLPESCVEGSPIDNRQTIDSLWANFHTHMQACSSSDPAGYREAVLAQEPILKALTSGFFDRLPRGIGHEDFAADNILFDAEGVSAIVDFDRNHYSYLWHDVGRAMLSFALKDSRMDTGRVLAFLEGYSKHLPLTLPDIADALRLSWCIEVPWWIRPEFFKIDREKVARFKDEVLWLTQHWFEMDSFFS
jgi:homoserine kinase type II